MNIPGPSLIRTACLLLVLMMCQLSIAQGQQEGRPYRLDDLLRAELIDGSAEEMVFAPDGQMLAFVTRRSRSSMPPLAFLDPSYVRRDVWLQDAPGRPAKNLTNGSKDQTGWWAPRWSPNGQRLAMLSSRGGRLGLWVWDRSSQRLQRVSSVTLDVATFRLTGPDRLFQWVDNDRFLCVVAPEGREAGPLVNSAVRAVEPARAAWALAEKSGLTVSVVDSLQFAYESRQLRLVGLDGEDRLVATTVTGPFTGSWWLSPDARSVAFIPPVPAMYGNAVAGRIGQPGALALRRFDGGEVVLDRQLPANILLQSLRWSTDGTELAFFAYGEAPLNPALLFGPTTAAAMPDTGGPLVNPAKLWRVNLSKGRVEQIEMGDISTGFLGAPSFMWTGSGEFLFRGARRGDTAGVAPPEWLVLARNGQARPLTTKLKKVPEQLYAIDAATAFIGLDAGEIWRIDPSTGETKNLTQNVSEAVSALKPPADNSLALTHLAFTTAGQRKTRNSPSATTQEHWILEMATQKVMPLKKPTEVATLLTFNQPSLSGLFHSYDRNGTSLWRETGRGRRDLLLEVNTFYRQVSPAQSKVIEFVSGNGRKLEAVLVLPYGYKPGRRYPLVVEFYPGERPDGNIWLSSSRSPTLAFDIWPAAGYAYLVPNSPRNLPELADQEPWSLFMTPNAVLPAVEKVVEAGIADPERLFINGWSLGGWGTVSVLTQTTRFKAAMAGAGFYNSRLYNVFGVLPSNIGMRYGTAPHDLSSPTIMGTSIRSVNSPSDIHTPFWRDGDSLRRNSPMSYVDRIQTPLLIIHGELDGAVSFSESEDLFRALSAMRKPARFARYWGEDHDFRYPANIRDMYQRVFAWFDDYGDIRRDATGNMIFDGDRVKSRVGAPALKPEDFAGFDVFLSSDAPVSTSKSTSAQP